MPVTFQHLCMQGRINPYGIGFHQLAGSLIIAFTLDVLYFGQQAAEQTPQLLIVVDADKCLAVADHKFHNFLFRSLFQCPPGNQLTVTHVSFLDIASRLDTHQLGHQSVHHVSIIFRLIRFRIRHQSQFHHTGIRNIIQSEQVGTRFLYR